MNNNNYEQVADAIKAHWYHLQPVLSEGTLWLGDWDSNAYVDLNTTDWLTAISRINEIRDIITAK